MSQQSDSYYAEQSFDRTLYTHPTAGYTTDVKVCAGRRTSEWKNANNDAALFKSSEALPRAALGCGLCLGRPVTLLRRRAGGSDPNGIRHRNGEPQLDAAGGPITAADLQ
jgi:hypothetical protein